MAKNFELVPLPQLKEQEYTQASEKTKFDNTIRMHVDVNITLAEKVRDHVYWTRNTQQQILLQALEEFIERNDIKSRPEEEKKKNRAGRKRKFQL